MTPRDRTLLEIFSAEQSEHVGRLRALADALGGAGATADRAAATDEALRRAHTLKGAARAVGLERTERLAHRLETVFARGRDGTLAFDASAVSVVHRVLDAVEDILASVLEDRPEPDTSAAAGALDGLLGGTPAAPAPRAAKPPEAAPPQPPAPAPAGAPGAHTPDLVRVNAASVDDLIRASAQLFAAIAAKPEAESRLEEQTAQAGDTLVRWERLRRQCAPYVRRRQDDPEFAPVLECLNYIDGRLRSLGAGTLAAAAAQRERDRELRLRSEELQRNAVCVRMTPAETVFGGFGSMVRDLAREQGKQIEYRAEGLETQADRAVLQGLKDPVMHLLRNAVSHGVGTPAERTGLGKPAEGSVRLCVDSLGGRLNVAVEDDGSGIDTAAILREAAETGVAVADRSPEEVLSLIFRPGFTTSRGVTKLAGRGMGLSVVQQAVSRMQGEIRVDPHKGAGTSFAISVPLSISTYHVLLVAAGGHVFGLPARFVERLTRAAVSGLQTVEGREAMATDSGPVPLARLSALLGLPDGPAPDGDGGERSVEIAVLALSGRRAGIVVDRFVDDREAVVKDLGIPDRMAGLTAGGVALEDGTVAPMLDPAGLLERFRDAGAAPAVRQPAEPARAKRRRILVVDDSITTRSLEKSILEAHGYEVTVAVDGVEALERLRAEPADLVITDILMPRMDGLQLLQEIKSDRALAAIPVIVVTSLERREDQERGLSLGADAYILKRKFDQRELLSTVRQIL